MKKRFIKAAFLAIYICAAVACIVLIPYGIWNAVLTYIFAAMLFCTPFLFFLLFTKKGKTALNKLRGKIFSLTSKNKSRNLMIDSGVTFRNKQCIEIGDNVSIANGAEFYPLGTYDGKTYPSKIVIGNNVYIGSYDRFASMESVIIEDDVLFAAYVHITDHSHEYRDVSMPVSRQGVFKKGPVRIGKGSWLGFRCNILSGVTIGEHSVIAAGAVVTKDVPPYSIAAGVPAKVVKRYDFERKEWVNVE